MPEDCFHPTMRQRPGDSASSLMTGLTLMDSEEAGEMCSSHPLSDIRAALVLYFQTVGRRFFTVDDGRETSFTSRSHTAC